MTACWGGVGSRVGGGSVEPPALVLSTPPWPKAPPANLKGPKESPLNPRRRPPHVFRRHDIILCTKGAGAGVNMAVCVNVRACWVQAHWSHSI